MDIKINPSQDYIIVHNLNTANVMKGFHLHDMYEIYITLSDNLKFMLDNNIFYVPKGSIFGLHPHVPHMTAVPEGIWFERYVIHISENYIQEINVFDQYNLFEFFDCHEENTVSHIQLNKNEIADIQVLLEKAMKNLKNDFYGVEVLRKTSMIEILLFLLRVKKEKKLQEMPSVEDKNASRVEKIINFINRNLENELSLDILSKEFYVSKFFLSRIFKEYCGTTPNQFITSRRIFKACELLQENIPVFMVCEEVGFSDYSHFIRTFKKYVGISPKQYALKYFDDNKKKFNNKSKQK